MIEYLAKTIIIALLILALLVIIFKTFKSKIFRINARKILYESAFALFLRNNRFTQIVLPSFTGAYFLCLDVWGSDWKIVSDHKPFHEFIFSILIIGSLCTAILRGIGDWYEGKSDKEYIAFIERFSVLTARVVSQKLARFKKNLKRLTPTGNTFRAITHPNDQIDIILQETLGLLREIFKISENAACITIMHSNPNKQDWSYIKDTSGNWVHTPAQELLKNGSTAANCLETGEAVFFPCKEEAAKLNLYYLSDRDRRMETGSVFCYPALIQTPNYIDSYVISIITYGPTLCDPIDTRHANAIKEILIDICRRIDLELTLRSMRDWQDFHSPTKKGSAHDETTN
ncbi:hypothetical protein [Microbulbifer sp. SAOS-129_SWC]|uniref:hypothetical protein n=1 Tax=Microbulbifer sp. SAOS-129_SWC TaxID=3145235 RepID=UPI003216587B